eukprot:m.337518 g.337518  ORF g.337518 m.337518 type:complete len:708 (+) comp18153_c0_seq1:79-2202(+)
MATVTVEDMERSVASGEAVQKQLGADLSAFIGEKEDFDGIVSANLKSLRSTNGKLKYQQGILEASLEAELKSSPSKKRALGGSTEIPTLLVQEPTYAFSFLRQASNLFAIAIAKTFPGVECEPMVSKNTAKVGKGGKGAAKTEPASYQCNVAMALHKKLKSTPMEMKSPRDVAMAIIKNLPSHPMISKCEAGGPGFINIHIDKKFASEQLSHILTSGVLPPSEKKKTVVVDFSSPNIAKDMHVGHLRSTIIGECIARLLEFVGHKVHRINHVGDWGTQFGMLIAHLKDKYPDYATKAPPISNLQEFYKDSKVRFDADEDFKARAYNEVVQLQKFEPEVTKAWKLICDRSREEFQKIYNRLDITIKEQGESFYQTRMLKIVEDMEAMGVLSDCPDGTPRKLLWPFGEPKEGDVPLTIKKQDGGFTYDTSDMATLRYRVEELKADWIVYVVDKGQSTHFDLIFGASQRLKIYDPSKVRIDHVGFGVVLGTDKKRLKSRSGETVKLKELLDYGVVKSEEFRQERLKTRESRNQVSPVLTEAEIKEANEALAYSCIKYTDLSYNRIKDYIFDFDKMISEKGNTAVYLINAYARIKQVFQQEEVKALDLEKVRQGVELVPADCTESHWKLAQHLLRFPEIIEQFLVDLLPSNLCDYVYELASTYHEFYEHNFIIRRKDGGKVDLPRLFISEATEKVLGKCFQIIGLRVVDKM